MLLKKYTLSLLPAKKKKIYENRCIEPFADIDGVDHDQTVE